MKETNKRKILIQCQSITYLYMGLGAINTKYPDEELDIDVVFTKTKEPIKEFVDKIKQSKYVNNVYIINPQTYEDLHNEMSRLKDNIFGRILYKYYYKPTIIKKINQALPKNNYTDIVFSQETQYHLMTFLKMIYPHTNFIIYGDGSGILKGKNVKLINPYRKNYDYKFFHEIRPNEIIALIPYIMDDSFNATGIPVTGTDNDTLKKLITEDTIIQKEINDYTDKFLSENADYQHKILILASRLDEPSFKMSKDDQTNIYIDMIEEYCPENSLVILKLHPTAKVDIAPVIQKACTKNCKIVSIPQDLKEYAIELYPKLIQNMDFVITFMSSATITLPYLFGTKINNAYDIIQKYPIKEKINIALDIYQNINKLLKTWDKKSVILDVDLTEEFKKYYENNGGYVKIERKPVLSLYEKLFSIKNVLIDDKKHKRITILGITKTI